MGKIIRVFGMIWPGIYSASRPLTWLKGAGAGELERELEGGEERGSG